MRKQDIVVGVEYTYNDRGDDRYSATWFSGCVVRVTGPAESRLVPKRGGYFNEKRKAVVFPVELVNANTSNPYVPQITYAEARQIIRPHSQTLEWMASRKQTEAEAAVIKAAALKESAAATEALRPALRAAGIYDHVIEALGSGRGVPFTIRELAAIIEAAGGDTNREA